MRTIKLTIGYLGENYNGWQVQKGQAHVRTVQRAMQKSLKLLTSEDSPALAAGRTDVGVNALGQVVVFQTKSSIPTDNIPLALNGILPEDIVVYKAEDVAADFHPIRDAVGKWYRYNYYQSKYPHVFFNKVSTCVPHKLDLEAMKRAALHLEGTHNFKSFCAIGGSAKSFERTIRSCRIIKEKSFVFIDIYANGFLYNMARIISGTLLKIGGGKIDPDIIPVTIKSRDRSLAGPTAPAKGLTLMRVDYQNEEKLFSLEDYLDITGVFY